MKVTHTSLPSRSSLEGETEVCTESDQNLMTGLMELQHGRIHLMQLCPPVLGPLCPFTPPRSSPLLPTSIVMSLGADQTPTRPWMSSFPWVSKGFWEK